LPEKEESDFLLPVREGQVEKVGEGTTGECVDGHGGLGEAVILP